MRIAIETPAGALHRLGWEARASRAIEATLFHVGDGARGEAELAQVRYEEGRLAVLDLGLSCRAWGHPDYPPAAVRAFIHARAKAA